MKELLKLNNIKVEIQENTIFEKINVNVQQGDIIGLIGKNGAGKSTLLQLINGKIEPSKEDLLKCAANENMTTAYVEQEIESFISNDMVAPQEEVLFRKWDVRIRDS